MRASMAGPAPADSSPDPAPELRLDALLARAPETGAQLVGPVSLVFSGGCWTALLGRSGAGKSSVLRALAGLIPSEALSGAIRVEDGAPLSGRVAWMAQDPLLAPWTSVRGNVVFGAEIRGERIDHAAAAAALDAVGLAALADRPPSALSGGERQRVALARTLYEDRSVALLDEPFSALDALTRDTVSALAARRLKGRTVIHVTHDPIEAARLADRILILAAEGDDAAEVPLGAAEALAPPRPFEAEPVFALAARLRALLGAAAAS